MDMADERFTAYYNSIGANCFYGWLRLASSRKVSETLRAETEIPINT